MLALTIEDTRHNVRAPILRRILDEVRKGPKRDIDLMCAIWGTKIGPKHETNSLSHHVWRLNEQLKAVGYRVQRPYRHGAYCLVSVPPTLNSRPSFKTYDPDGIFVGG